MTGWQEWIKEPPPDGVLIEICRRDGEKPKQTTTEEIMRWLPYNDPGDWLTHFVGLYWRLTGIGRMQMEERCEEA